MVLHSLKILGYCNLLKGSKHERLLFPRSKWRSPMHSLIQEISHRPVKHFFANFLQYKLIELAVLFDHTSSSIIFSYWIPKSIMEQTQSSQLKSVFYKKLKKHWNVEGSLKFKLRMPKVWRKKQKLKSLPAESQRLWELNLSWICWTSKSGCFRFFFYYPPIPLRSKKPMLSRSNSPVLLFSMKGVKQEEDSEEDKNHIVLTLFNYTTPSILRMNVEKRCVNNLLHLVKWNFM